MDSVEWLGRVCQKAFGVPLGVGLHPVACGSRCKAGEPHGTMCIWKESL